MTVSTGRDAVSLHILVRAPAKRAFAAFTAGLQTWWPPEYTWAGASLASIGIQPGAGGRCYERDHHGFERDWGRVLAWDPPRRLLLAWMVDPGRTARPTSEQSSEIEVRFEPDGIWATRVRLEHRGFSRHGRFGPVYLAAFASPSGWPYLLQRYAATADA